MGPQRTLANPPDWLADNEIVVWDVVGNAVEVTRVNHSQRTLRHVDLLSDRGHYPIPNGCYAL